MKIKPSSYMLMLILAFALYMGIYALTYSSLKARLVPLAASTLILVLGSIQLAKEVETARKEKSERKVDSNDDDIDDRYSRDSMAKANIPNAMKAYLVFFGWLFGLVAFIYMLGFLVAIPLFIALYLKIIGRSWLGSLVPAVIAVVVVYFLFIDTLHVELFPGVLFGGAIRWL